MPKNMGYRHMMPGMSTTQVNMLAAKPHMNSGLKSINSMDIGENTNYQSGGMKSMAMHTTGPGTRKMKGYTGMRGMK